MEDLKNTLTNTTQTDEANLLELLKNSQTNTKSRSWQYNLVSGSLVWIDEEGILNKKIIEEQHLLLTYDLFGEIVEQDVEMVQTALLNLSGQEKVITYCAQFKGQPRYYKAFFNALAIKNKVDCYNGTIQDITEFKYIENHLKDINEAFQQSEELANLGNWKYNLSNGKYSYSGNLYKIFGVEEKQFDPGMENFSRFVHPDDKEKITTSAIIIDHAGHPQNSNFRIITPAGQIKSIKSISKAIQNSLGEKLILGTIQDVTKEQRLMHHLSEKASLNEMIFKNSVDYVAAFNTDLKVTAWNRKCEEKTGVTREEAIGRHVLEIFKDDEGNQLLEDLQNALKGKSIHREETVREREFYDMFVLPITGEDGYIFGVLCISHDLTAVKTVTNKLVELNQSLKNKNDQLEQSNNELASFSYVASHDLQEPLRKIQTFSSRIMEKEYQALSPQGIEYFKRMDLAAKRMQTLIDDLLTFSRTNTQPRNFKEVDLNYILEEVKNDIRETIDEKNAIIVSERLPMANVISFQFHQLIENLLLNALKYNQPGTPPYITVSCNLIHTSSQGQEVDLMPGKYYKIDFKDNGIGFDQEYQHKIFELFQRLHGKSEYPGTGLGLAICKRIMQNHKGAIKAEGVPGRGATFSVYLPV